MTNVTPNHEAVPFNKPYMTGKELYNIAVAHHNNMLAGDGPFTTKCHAWLQAKTGCHKALLTHSCTAALEMSAILLDIQPGDEIIMPSYTFVSTANAFVLRGGVPVFVDIRPDTLNLDETKIEAAITNKTKAIVPVHYAGVPCAMGAILAIAKQHNLAVIEDSAQGLMSSYNGQPLGSIGDLGTFSFHETKNIISGEGGALIINNPKYKERAEIIREKGTNRSQFIRGDVDKYTWRDIGSSFLPGELIAAFLHAQFDEAEDLTQQRLASWNHYHEALKPFEDNGLLTRPFIPEGCQHNGHLYYIILSNSINRNPIIAGMKEQGLDTLFHYVPLHSSPAGKRYCRTHGQLKVTENAGQQLLRLPLWVGIRPAMQQTIIHALTNLLYEVAETKLSL